MNLADDFTSEEKGYGADEIDYRLVDASEISVFSTWPLVDIRATFRQGREL